MNPYSHKQIENSLDVRLVDLFVKQNPSNDWISIDDAAAWVYETNTVKPHHKRYVVHKIVRIIGSIYTQEEHDSFLESGYIDVDGSPEYAYRLKDAEKRTSRADHSKQAIIK